MLMPKLVKVRDSLALPTMATTTLSTAEALAKLKVADEATLMSEALTTKACDALVLVLVNEISRQGDTVAAVLLTAAAQSWLAVALSWAASAVKLTVVRFCTEPSRGRPLAKPGREIRSAEFSATREPHWTPALKMLMVALAPPTMMVASLELLPVRRVAKPKLEARRLPKAVATRPSTSPLVMSKVKLLAEAPGAPSRNTL